MEPINANEFETRQKNGDELNLLDVRGELEYKTYNIGGKNIPLNTLPKLLNELDYNKTDELIVICTMGLRSETASALLNQHGYKNVRNLTGGLIALQKLNKTQ